MPKQLVIEPEHMRRKGEIKFASIPVHSYDRAFSEERAARGDAALKNILRHMMIVREFETMLGTFKATGAYRDIPFTYKGPAHLSIGQEGAAVGAALALAPNDHIFGSHRSHGEFIAKSLAAIDQLDPASLEAIMAEHEDGRLRDGTAAHIGGEGKALAENFMLFGLLSEIFMRSNGFNGGMGGSMHAFFPPFGAYPNNAIVGGSAGIATGAALRKKLARENGICVANAGDGSTGCGPVWEAMNFASMAQFNALWDESRKGGLPVLFFFSNNFYAMGGQTIGETMGWERLSRIGAAINADSMHAETIDGTNPLAVADAVARKKALLLEGRGPALLDVECYRSAGHSTTDANVYRSRDELKAWEAFDPIVRFQTQLVEDGVMTEGDVLEMREIVGRTIEAVTRAAVDPEAAPIVNVEGDPTLIGKLMFTHNDIAPPSSPVPLIKQPEDVAAFRQLKRKSRFGLDADGNILSGMRAITLRDGLTESILHHMTLDESLVAYGEECREWGGAFGVYRGLSEILPYHRLFNSPISEAAIVATAVGHALEGGRSLVELMYGDFIGRAGDEIFNQMAKWHAMSGGMLNVPVVLRCSVGSKYGAQHSQDWSSLIAHIPGLKVIYPATPYDAKGLMASALSSNDPVVFFESQRLYDTVEKFQPEGVPEDYYRIPIGEPDIKRSGNDLTILTIGPSLYPALAAAEALDKSAGLSVEVIDARSLVPFNYDKVLESVKKTGFLLIVSEASERGSFAMTLSSNVSRFAFGDLKAAPRVLGSPNWIVPGAEMESTYFPQVADIIDVVTGEFFPEKKTPAQGSRNWDARDLARMAL
ncbi:alpha-ketoacid dehydrogenase subunit alpha/beta [Pelagibacterium lentulum]|uniref:2-oxoglutarate dehydrogenase E1 component n=1 Tax=Pelagibacterium lentulum TaxID=2029865 RepID=A0A916RAI6_9HYPH|nr:alpha-ketoacid dehydrogenase subunit alpha/beta [Pelagibacterium lentulum]GGA48330.1 pyruvate dehydrogenase E1 subunit beta [Pelagibacterium lentulum]